MKLFPQIIFIVITVIALSVIVLWFLGKNSRTHFEDELSHVPVFVLASWLVASAVFGPAFYVLRIAGVFDITIERLLFILLIGFLMFGLFTGKVNLKNKIAIELAMTVFLLIL